MLEPLPSAKSASAAKPVHREPPIPPTNSKQRNHAKGRESLGGDFDSLQASAVIGTVAVF
jgi:hypothetical protein